MTERVVLGPFELGERVGEGGMGVVYRGRHRSTGVNVAVKVLRQAFSQEANRKFEREVQAHARLQHPGVVHLFEYGSVPDAAESDTEGVLTAGSPFVAMELADGGTVRDAMPLHSWEAVRRVLEQILDALAHAHARDVIHRDLKPDNFLLFDDDDVREGRLKLADFGIAHAMGEEEARNTGTLATASGTPLYMAPEQAKAQWRHYGPWTDLYSLGCITWELVCGRPPFSGSNNFKTLMMHQKSDRPELEPNFPIPRGAEAWVHRAMARSPDHRFRRAADALRALSAVGRVDQHDGSASRADGGASSGDAEEVADAVTELMGPTLGSTQSEWMQDTLGDPERPLDENSMQRKDSGVPISPDNRRPDQVVPPDWEQTIPKPDSTPLVGTGIGLFGLRSTPFVDRDSERDEIWSELAKVEREAEPRLIALVGETGVGKTRVAEWMATRAHELGAANILRALHTTGGAGPNEGLRGTVRRAIRGQKLTRGEFFDHLLEWLPELEDQEVNIESDAAALTEFVFPTDSADEEVDGPRYQFSSEGQQYALLKRMIRRYGSRRPPFILFDDVHWGAFSIRMLSHLLQSSDERPTALIVLTIETDALAEQTATAQSLRNILAHKRCRRVDLGRLDPADHRDFVERLLPMEPASRERLASRTEGNPMFAVQSLQSLLENDELESGESGYRLPDGVASRLPDDIHDLWIRRVAKTIDEVCEGDQQRDVLWAVMELVAVLGRGVTGEEWEAAGEELGVPEQVMRIQRALIRRGLLEQSETLANFSHGLLVESLQRRAREAGRWQRHNERCAHILERIYGSRSIDALMRRASHWSEAGRSEAALEPLMEAYAEWRRLGEYERGLEVLERRAELLDEAGIGEDDPRTIENVIDMSRCRMAVEQERGDALETLRAGRQKAERIGDNRLLAKALVAEAWECRMQADFERAGHCSKRAVEAGRAANDADELALAFINLGWTRLSQNRLSTADEAFQESIKVASSANLTLRRLMGIRGAATVALMSGDFDSALEKLEPALAESREKGLRLAELQLMNAFGEAARWNSDVGDARSAYTRCLELARELNQPGYETNCRINFAQLDVLDGNFEAAHRGLREARSGLEKESRLESRMDVLRMAEAAWAAGVERWERYDELLSYYDEGLAEGERLIRDYPWLLEIAAGYARDHGDETRSQRALRLARHLWDQLDNEGAVQRVEEMLED